MKRNFLTILLAVVCAAASYGQTIKALGYNTNGQVIYSGTNTLTFTNDITFQATEINFDGAVLFNNYVTGVFQGSIEISEDAALTFEHPPDAAITRTNLGIPFTTAVTNTNAAGWRSSLGLGATNDVGFGRLLFNNDWHLVSSPDGGGFELRWPLYNSITTISLGGNAIGYGIRLGSLGAEATDFSYGFTTNNASGAAKSRTNFGATALGDAIFTAANQTVARQALGLQSYTNTLTNSVGTVEIGSTNNTATVGWTIAPTNATYALRTLVRGTNSNAITNNQSTLTFSNLGLINDTTWTLTVGDGQGVTNTATTSVLFQNYMIWGRSTNAALNNAALQSLHTSGGGAGRAFSTSRSRSITMDGGGQYLFIAYPQGFGAASFAVGGLPNSAWTVATNSYTNASGYATNYLIYRTDTIQNGTGINIVVQ